MILWNGAHMAPGPVLQGFSFFPRGGSAQVVRYLTAALLLAGWTPRIVAGSLGETGNPSNATTFFGGLPVSAVDFSAAFDAWLRGEDPLDQPVPLHASYEDKPGAPDRIFAAVSPELAVRQVDSWRRLLTGLGPPDPLVLHLHHLTPLHDAAEAVWPDVPILTHLHGTELLMLEQIEQYGAADGSSIGLPPSWRYAEYWAHRLRATAHRSKCLLAVSTDHAARAVRVLGVPEDRVTVVPNGVDTKHFRRVDLTANERLASAATLARRRPARVGRERPPGQCPILLGRPVSLHRLHLRSSCSVVRRSVHSGETPAPVASGVRTCARPTRSGRAAADLGRAPR